MTEIKIHQSLYHRHIVEFIGFFEDEKNIYIILELCENKVRFECIIFAITMKVPHSHGLSELHRPLWNF